MPHNAPFLYLLAFVLCAFAFALTLSPDTLRAFRHTHRRDLGGNRRT